MSEQLSQIARYWWLIVGVVVIIIISVVRRLRGKDDHAGIVPPQSDAEDEDEMPIGFSLKESRIYPICPNSICNKEIRSVLVITTAETEDYYEDQVALAMCPYCHIVLTGGMDLAIRGGIF